MPTRAASTSYRRSSPRLVRTSASQVVRSVRLVLLFPSGNGAPGSNTTTPLRTSPMYVSAMRHLLLGTLLSIPQRTEFVSPRHPTPFPPSGWSLYLASIGVQIRKLDDRRVKLRKACRAAPALTPYGLDVVSKSRGGRGGGGGVGSGTSGLTLASFGTPRASGNRSSASRQLTFLPRPRHRQGLAGCLVRNPDRQGQAPEQPRITLPVDCRPNPHVVDDNTVRTPAMSRLGRFDSRPAIFLSSPPRQVRSTDG